MGFGLTKVAGGDEEPAWNAAGWSALAEPVAGVADLEGPTRQHGALVRARKVRRAGDLLRLALM